MAAEKKDPKSTEERRKQVRPGGESERRGYIRTDSSVDLTLFVDKSGTKEEIKTTTRNISATGMMVESSDQLPVGTEAKIDLSPPDGPNPVHFNGKIIWSEAIPGFDKFSSGIEFTQIEEDNKNTFLKYYCDFIYGSTQKNKKEE